jgi:site-specific recombinase XerD
MFDLIPTPTTELATLTADRVALDLNLQAGKAASTRAAYRSDGRAFATWCRARGLDPLAATPDTIALHLSSAAGQGLAPSSCGRRLAGIAYFLQTGGVSDEALPTRSKLARETLAGIRRRHAQPSKRKAAATTDVVRALLDTCGTDMLGLRDRALLTLGFGCALRRSELVALNVADIEEVKEGLRVTIRRSKTDQLGAGYTVPLGHGSRLRPVAALQAWLHAAGIEDGPLFLGVHRSGKVRPQRARKGVIYSGRLTAGMVGLVVKRRAILAGLDSRQFSGHSLRAGFVTSAAEHGANIFKIMDVTRHKSVDVLKGYVRSREMFKDYAGDGIL